MKSTIEERLQSLKTEYEAGQKAMTELDAKQASLQATLLRISGAIQVLEEVLEAAPGDTSDTSNDAKENVDASEEISIDAVSQQI